MKKRLLFAAFALLAVAPTFAYEVGEYAYNTTQRFKIEGENIVVNGNFANGRDNWFGADAEVGPSAEVWDVVEGVGPNGETVLQSLAATADLPLCNSWKLDAGTYIVSFDIKYLTTGTTAVSTNTSAPANTVDFFLNTDGAFKKVASTDEAPVVNVAAARDYIAEEWKSIVYYFNVDAATNLVMHFEKLPEGTQITNIEIHKAYEVYDIRKAQARLNHAKTLIADPNFNTDEAQGAKAELEETIAILEGMMESGELDDVSNAEGIMGEFESQQFEPFLAVTTENLAIDSYFKNIAITGMNKLNRGQIANGQIVDGFKFTGDNWYHGNGADFLIKYIGPGANNHNGAGVAALYNKNLPAGKYYVSAEIRNGWTAKDWAIKWDFDQADIIGFVGTDSTNFGTIKGEEWTRFYVVKELKEGETFEAGFYWNAPDVTNPSGCVQVRNFEVRSFGNVAEKVARLEAWSKFLPQYNALVSAREKLLGMLDNKAYPWEQDSLKRAQAQWDPLYNEFMAKGWVSADGTDTGVATTAELEDWATTTGVYDMEAPYDKYGLVRGYQYATNFVATAAQAVTVLANEITAATQIRDDAMLQTGDKTTFQAAIDAAQKTLDGVKGSTTDTTREADEATLTTALETLKTAEETFKASAKLDPVVSIDFSNAATKQTAEDETEVYVVKGAAGEMVFKDGTIQTDNSLESTEWDSWLFGIGYKEECEGVLHVGGNGYGTVALGEAPADDDVLRVYFDVWYGNLGKGFLDIDLLNAAGERVAGFSLDRYNGNVGYNDFNNDENTGMDIKAKVSGLGSSSVGNAGICVDANKSSFDLTVDYKGQVVKGKLVNAKNGTTDGAYVKLNDTLEDNKIVSFRVGSDSYQKANSGAHARRCWFDNLLVYKYKSVADGPIDTAVKTIETVKANDNAIYTIGGVRVSNATKPGLYIQNGKKFVVK